MLRTQSTTSSCTPPRINSDISPIRKNDLFSVICHELDLNVTTHQQLIDHLKSYSQELKVFRSENEELKSELSQFKDQNISNSQNNIPLSSLSNETFNESTEQFSNSPIQSSNSMLNEEGKQQTIASLEHLSRLQSKEIQDMSSKQTFLLNRFYDIINITEHYDQYLCRVEENEAILSNSLSDTEEKLMEIQNNIDILHDDVTEIISNNIPEYDFPLYQNSNDINNFISKVIQQILEREKENFISKDKYETILVQFEELIKLLIEIANKGNKETNQKTLLLTQCARIGCFIDEHMNENQIEEGSLNATEIGNFFDPKGMINTFFNSISEDELTKTPYREIMAFFVGIVQINELLMENNQNLIEEKEDLLKCIINLNDEKKMIDDWKINQQNNISLIEDTLGEVDCPPNEVIPNLLKVYKDTFNENQMLTEEILKHQKSKQIEESMDDLKTQFTKLEKDYMVEKLKYQKDVNDLENSILKKDKELIELKHMYEKSNEDKMKLEQELELAKANNKQIGGNLEDIRVQLTKIQNENEFLRYRKQEDECELKSLLDQTKINQQQYDQNQKENEIKEEKLIQKIIVLKNQISYAHCFIEKSEKQFKLLGNKYKSLKKKQRISEKTSNELKSTQKELDSKVFENSVLANKILDITEENASLKTHVILLQQREAGLKRNEDNMKNKFIHEYESVTGEYEEMKKSIVNILHENFRSKSSFSETFESLIAILKDKINEIQLKNNSLIKTNNQISVILSLREDENRNMKNENEKINEEIKRMRIENMEIKSRLSSSSKDLEEILESKIWNKWAKSLCNRICGKLVTSTADMRFAIEEMMLCSVGYREIYQKLEILRFEKKFMVMNATNNIKKPINASKIAPKSIGPLLIIITFSGRLKKMTGSKQLETILLRNNEKSRSFIDTIKTKSTNLSFS